MHDEEPTDATGAARLDAVELAVALTGARAARLSRHVDGRFEVVAYAGFGARDHRAAPTLCARVAASAVPVELSAPDQPREAGDPDVPAPWRRIIGVALASDQPHPWGCLTVFYDSECEAAPRDARERLARLGRQVALAIGATSSASTLHARQLERVQRIAEVGHWEHRIGEGGLRWSDEIFRIFGVDRETFAPTFDAFLACVHPDDQAAMQAAHAHVVAGAMPLDLIHRIVRPDGAVRVVRERGELVVHGERLVVAGTVQDVTLQAEVEQQLRLSEERFREMAETIEDVFWTWDVRADRILYASPSYETVFGQSRAELYRDSRSFQRVIDPEDLPALLDAIARNPHAIDVEYRIIRPDGERRWIDVRTFPVRDADGTVLRTVGIGRDVTPLKTAEQALLRTQRIESIGTLAGGIAHDLNNVLTPIVMAAGLLASTARDGNEADLIETITASAERGAAMVRQVLAFARGVDGQRTPLRLEQVVADITRLIRDTFDRRIALEVHVQPGLWSVAGDATQLHQVLLNLAVNARDAMPEGGRLRLDARNAHIDGTRAASLVEGAAGRFVAVTVSDTGTGIDPALHDRVFDPFFTTKPLGQGTGLGLSTVQSLVRSHGGSLVLDSEVGRGTTFTVYLPALDAIENGFQASEVGTVPHGGGRLVLVVDDEDAVRMVMRATLEMFQYRVTTATNGVEGLAAFEAAPGSFAALITDMMMPGGDGHALIDAARRIRPDVPIVAASGLGTPQMLERVAAAGVRHFLSKPYTSEQLLLTVASAIAAAPQPPRSAGR